jgi:hypothetical protein
VGNIASGATIQPYTFATHVSHINGSGTMKVMFHHSDGTGVNSHALHIDKVEVENGTPLAAGATLAEIEASTVITGIASDVSGLNGAAMRGTDNAALASVCTEARLSELDAATSGKVAAEIDLIKTDVAAILADTGTDGVVVATASKTGYALSSAGVDAILDDAPSAELSSVPSTTGTLRQMIQFLFQYFRNKKTVTSTVETLYKEDASTSLGTATVSDDGATFTKGEMS